MDNSLYRTASWVPMVSSIERLHYAYRIDGNSCSDIRIVRASEDNPVITVHHCAVGSSLLCGGNTQLVWIVLHFMHGCSHILVVGADCGMSIYVATCITVDPPHPFIFLATCLFRIKHLQRMLLDMCVCTCTCLCMCVCVCAHIRVCACVCARCTYVYTTLTSENAALDQVGTTLTC